MDLRVGVIFWTVTTTGDFGNISCWIECSCVRNPDTHDSNGGVDHTQSLEFLSVGRRDLLTSDARFILIQVVVLDVNVIQRFRPCVGDDELDRCLRAFDDSDGQASVTSFANVVVVGK